MSFDLKNYIKKLDLVKQFQVKKNLNKYVYQYRLSQKDISKAECSEMEKRKVMERWGTRHIEKNRLLNTLIDKIFHELSMNDDNIRLDMLFCYAAYGFTPNEYLVYLLKDKSAKERKTFISDRESVVIGYRLNDLYSMRILNDKVQTYHILGKYFKRKALCIEGENDRSAFLEFAKSTPVFVKKDAKEACGRSVERIDLQRQNITADYFFDKLPPGRKIIVEELIQQADVMRQFNDSSVNTVRCTTLNVNGTIKILFCFLRTGRTGSFVDNGGAGGLIIGIDDNNGVLCTEAVDEVNHRFSEHPDSHVVFRGFQLPDWPQMIRICKEMAGLIPDARIIGWDMAYTNEGWVVVEGNALTEMIGPQSTSRKGFRNKLKEFLENNG